MKRAILATLILSAVPLFAVSASAGEAIETQLIMREGPPAFHGKVKAALDDCVEGREIKLYRKKVGNPKKLLGTDISNSNGRWKVTDFILSSGTYYAFTPQNGPCKKDRSKKLSVD